MHHITTVSQVSSSGHVHAAFDAARLTIFTLETSSALFQMRQSNHRRKTLNCANQEEHMKK